MVQIMVGFKWEKLGRFSWGLRETEIESTSLYNHEKFEF
jgi:hypothetical protein